jgi:hypothetical protein
MPAAALRAAPASAVLDLAEIAVLLGSIRSGRYQPMA